MLCLLRCDRLAAAPCCCRARPVRPGLTRLLPLSIPDPILNTHTYTHTQMLESAETRRAALAVVWFGANDATDPDGPQAYMTVPPARYAANLKRIATDLKAAGVQHVLIVTPPPVDDAKRAAANPAGVADRRFALTARYAAAAMGAARELALPALDMFKALQELAPGGAWSDRFMLSDGLHFNDEGNAAVFR